MIDKMFLFVCFLLLPSVIFHLSFLPFPSIASSSSFVVIHRLASSFSFKRAPGTPCCRAALFLPWLSSSFLTVCHSICWQTHLFRIGHKRTMMSYFVSVQRPRLIEPNLGSSARFFFASMFFQASHP